MKSPRSLIPLVLAAAAALLLAGCGGGGTAKLSSDDVAVVGSSHITQNEFTAMMARGKAALKSQGQAFPKQGTSQYETLKGQAVTALVQQTELNDKATSLGVTVTPKQVDARLEQIKKQYYSGSDKKLNAAIAAQHTTLAIVKSDLHDQMLDQALFEKVTKDVKVSDKQIDAYFHAHPTTYPGAASSRQVRHILVKSKTLANSIYAQLKSGTDQTWCKLAKKYSQDPSSKDKCGKLTVTKGETVPVFDTVAFTTGKTGVVHAPVYDSLQYKAYFVIEPLSNIKPGAKQPTAAEKAQIQQTLSGTAKNTFMTNWVTDLQKSYCKGKVKYATGYQPSPDPCTTLTTSTSTSTTTG